MKIRWSCTSPLLAAALCLLNGCTTTYVGKKMDPSGGLPKKSGIPFVMSKPQYKVDITADPSDGTKAIYTLSAEDVPDATKRFTVALDPALWVDGKFDLDFASNGSLSGATSTTSTRLVDTFSALVSLVLKVQSAGILDAVTTMQEYKAIVGSSTEPACIDPYPDSTVKVQDAIRAEIVNLEAEATREVGDIKNASKAVAETVAARLHYTDAFQKRCMEAVAKAVEGLAAAPQRSFDESVNAAQATQIGTEDDRKLVKRYLETIKGLVAAYDEDGLKAVDDDLKGKAAPYDQVRDVAAKGLQLVGAMLHSRFARSLPSMSPEVWGARHLAHLERRIVSRKLDLLLLRNEQRSQASATNPKEAAAKATRKEAEQVTRDAVDKATKDVAALESEWAETLGEVPTVQRVARIDAFLLAIKDLAPGDATRRNSANEQVRLREERDRLQAQVAQSRAALLAKNKIVALSREKAAPVKVEPRTNVPVFLAKKKFVEVANSRKVSDSDPEFVLVLEADMGGAIEGATQ